MPCTCHNVLHDGYHVGGLAERGGIVVFILKQREGGEAGWEKGKMVKQLQESVMGMLLGGSISRWDQFRMPARGRWPWGAELRVSLWRRLRLGEDDCQ